MEKEIRPQVGIMVPDEIGNQAEVVVLNPDDVRRIGFFKDCPAKIGVGLEEGLPMGLTEMTHADKVVEEGPKSPVGKTVVVVPYLFLRQFDEPKLITSLGIGFGNGNPFPLHRT